MKLLLKKFTAVVSIVIGTFCVALSSLAADGEDQYFVIDPNANKYVVILVGASVGPEYEQKFFSWGTNLRHALVSGYGYQPDNVRMLLGNKPKDHAGLATLGACRSENIEKLFNQLAKEMKPEDQLTVFLIGHGSGFGEDSKFNIVGPDVTGAQFGKMLSVVKARSVIVMNTTSASHDFSRALAGLGRVVLSATRSASEKYDTKFPEYLLEGIKDHSADRDKNQRLSVLEAFMFASDRVQNFFRDEGRLATEHSALDDNADGIFTLEPNTKQADGRLAEIAYLDVGAGSEQTLSAAAAKLKTQMDNLERSVFLLRGEKASMSEQQYWQRMEPLLIDLAKVNQAFLNETGNSESQ